MLSALLWNCKVSNRRPLKHPVRWLLSFHKRIKLASTWTVFVGVVHANEQLWELMTIWNCFKPLKEHLRPLLIETNSTFAALAKRFEEFQFQLGHPEAVVSSCIDVFLLYSYSILTFRNSGRWKIWWSLHECWVYALLKSLRFMNMQQLNSFWIPTWFYCWKT